MLNLPRTLATCLALCAGSLQAHDGLRVPLAPLAPQVQARALGDWPLALPVWGQDHDFRVTGGVLLAQRSSRLGLQPAPTTAWPYLGVGWRPASLADGLRLRADLGLAAQNAGALKLGRVLSRDLDEQLRDLRLRPLLQLGLSYSF